MRRSRTPILFSLPILLFCSTALIAQEGPTISSVNRPMAFPHSTEDVPVSFVLKPGSAPIDPQYVTLCYSVDGAAPECVAATAVNDTDYTATIPKQTAEAIVTYWINAADDQGHASINPSDTTLFKYYYAVIDNRIAIYDVQHSPNLGGMSGSVGFQLTLLGTVMADTSDLPGGPDGLGPMVTIQDSRSGWSGIAIPATDTAGNIIPSVAALRRGDPVTVLGTVRERNGLTILENATASPSAPLGSAPDPILRSTADIGSKLDGTTDDAEKWESMVIEYQEVIVTDTAGNEPGSGEYRIADISLKDDTDAEAFIETDDSHAGYTAREPMQGETKIREGWTFSYIRGVLVQEGDRYKLIPRSLADYRTLGSGTGNRFTPMEGPAIVLHPNPTSDNATVEMTFAEATTAAVELLDATGVRIATILSTERVDAGPRSLPIETGALASGTYFIRIVTPQGVENRALTVVR